METISIIFLIFILGWFLDKRASDRAKEKEKILNKLDEILTEINYLNQNINPDDDYTN